MKTTLNVNIAQRAFTIDSDAYEMLKNYLEDVSERFEPSEASETLSDFESRISDLFSNELASSRQVVTTEMVRHAISVLGQADEFGSPHYDKPHPEQQPVKRLRRSRTDRMIGGVCGGLAEYFSTDVTVIRILAVLLLLFGGSSLPVYIIMWIVMPQEPFKILQ